MQASDELRQYIRNAGVDIDNNMNEVLRESFINTRKFVWKGVFTLLFYFSAVLTLKDGVLPLLTLSIPNQNMNNANSTSSSYASKAMAFEDKLAN